MKVLLIGANGRMGKMMQVVLKENDCTFLGIDKENREEAKLFDADVILDFSLNVCLAENLELAQEKNVPIVIATTGHDETNQRLIADCSNSIPIFKTANFSIMFNVLLNLTKQLKVLKDCDFVLEDTHHRHKKDSPSGSCKEIIESLKNNEITPKTYSHRVGEIVGIHEIKIFGDNETLQLKHEVYDRKVFCEGALKACKFIQNKKAGLYGMNDLLEELGLEI